MLLLIGIALVRLYVIKWIELFWNSERHLVRFRQNKHQFCFVKCTQLFKAHTNKARCENLLLWTR